MELLPPEANFAKGYRVGLLAYPGTLFPNVATPVPFFCKNPSRKKGTVLLHLQRPGTLSPNTSNPVPFCKGYRVIAIGKKGTGSLQQARPGTFSKRYRVPAIAERVPGRACQKKGTGVCTLKRPKSKRVPGYALPLEKKGYRGMHIDFFARCSTRYPFSNCSDPVPFKRYRGSSVPYAVCRPPPLTEYYAFLCFSIHMGWDP